jgi:hypothetical protein
MTSNDDKRVIASYSQYADAERAVDYLSDRGFPVQRVAIIGWDLKLVEQVTGRMTYRGAVLRGMAGGAVTGALIGWVFGLFDWINPLVAGVVLAIYGLIFGAIIGAVIGLVVHWSQHGRRDFASVATVQPTRYDLLVDAAVADQAAELLHDASPAPSRHRSGV